LPPTADGSLAALEAHRLRLASFRFVEVLLDSSTL
jgi:hypothetical protein